LKHSPVGNLLKVQLTATTEGKFNLEWYLDLNAMEAAQRGDGRYRSGHQRFQPVLSTNAGPLPARKMRVEKRFEVCKQDLKVRLL